MPCSFPEVLGWLPGRWRPHQIQGDEGKPAPCPSWALECWTGAQWAFLCPPVHLLTAGCHTVLWAGVGSGRDLARCGQVASPSSHPDADFQSLWVANGQNKSRRRLWSWTSPGLGKEPASGFQEEKAMATHSSVLAWRDPGMGEPGGLPSMGSHRVRHDWSDLAAATAVFQGARTT